MKGCNRAYPTPFSLPIDLYSVENAFKSELTNHHGTHRDVFLRTLGTRLETIEEFAVKKGLSVSGVRKAVVNELEKIKNDALQGEFLR